MEPQSVARPCTFNQPLEPIKYVLLGGAKLSSFVVSHQPNIILTETKILHQHVFHVLGVIYASLQ